jgi:site-specific DNA recombinase
MQSALLQDSDELYRQCDDGQRKLINRALFKRLYVRDDEVVKAEFNEPFNELISARDGLAGTSEAATWPVASESVCNNLSDRLEIALTSYAGSSKSLMVEMTGIEPATSCLQSRRSTN